MQKLNNAEGEVKLLDFKSNFRLADMKWRTLSKQHFLY